MKKMVHKLSIRRETLVSLQSPILTQAAGGSNNDTVYHTEPVPVGNTVYYTKQLKPILV